MKRLSETAVLFWDEKERHEDHEAFKRWQRDNNRGFVINFPDDGPPMLHKAGCPHIRAFDSNPNVSLTMHRKLCSTDAKELVNAARDLSVEFKRCETCGNKSHAQLR